MGPVAKEKKVDRDSTWLSDEDATSTLLHDMAHAAVGSSHGMPWKVEMIRLRSAGALLAIDLCINNAIIGIEVRYIYAQAEGERRSS
jgi:hypothetical protein